MLAIKPDVRLALSEEIMLQAIPELDHYYAFNIVTGDQYQLNHTAHWVLDTFRNINDFHALIGEFAQTFDIGLERAEEDLIEVIQFALENSIVKEIEP